MVKRVVNKRGQVTIFVIIALVIIAGVAFYFAFKGTLFSGGLSATFEPVESSFLNCIQEKTETGIKILGSKGGHMENPEFVPGSGYMPYSSELDFLGVGIPYWRSISGSNILINQIPTRQEMQNQLANYIELGVQDCNFETFLSQGYLIQKGPMAAQVTIRGDSVDVSLNMDLNLEKDEESAVVSKHDVTVNSQIGNLYDDAVNFYNLENEGMIIENYSVDILRTYAPVDGFELSCSPKIWNADEIFDTLKNATQDNFFALKNSGRNEDYFNMKVPIDSEVRIINSRDWPSVYEVEPANSPILVAEPVGNQQGLGVVGFCYVPYHFVYNLRYPV
ncbi:MAG: hypothetical protein KKB62_00155, partial [Nanoarchaeota archaeon]|nr:hypothetical protein [Nanoarchaeota archaeon]